MADPLGTGDPGRIAGIILAAGVFVTAFGKFLAELRQSRRPPIDYDALAQAVARQKCPQRRRTRRRRRPATTPEKPEEEPPR